MWLMLGGALLVVGAAYLWLRDIPREDPLELNASVASLDRTKSVSPVTDGQQFVVIGGVKRPVSDVTPTRPSGGWQAGDAAAADAASAAAAKALDYGQSPPVAQDANPEVRSAVEAIRAKNHPERLAVNLPPQPFDAAAYAADPNKYLQTLAPGRVFQPAQPGPGVPRIVATSPRLAEIQQGETITLQVKAAAGAPVTFTSLDLGAFENQLTSITVKANAQGLAEAQFTGTPGTIENVHILAASPMASGQARFTVNVAAP